MGRKIIFAVLMILCIASVRAAPTGSPVSLPPRGALEVSAAYSKLFLYAKNPTYKSEYTSQRLTIRIGYVFYKWLELYGIFGGGDADLLWDRPVGGTPFNFKGSWELMPGVGLRIMPPTKFDALGLKFHMLFDGDYCFIRSRQAPVTIGVNNVGGKVKLNEFEGSGIIVGYYRKFNLSLYAGIAVRYIWSEIEYNASNQITDESYTGELGLGTSTQDVLFPHQIYPIFGLNWHFVDDYTICLETNVADIGELKSLAPKFGYNIAISNYR